MRKIITFIILGILLFSGFAMAGIPGFMRARMGTLKGELHVEGKPLPNVIVSFFDKNGGPPPVVGSARRVPDMVSRANDRGEFSTKLLPGQYYMGAMVRKVGDGPGPPRAGEPYFFIRDKAGKLRSMEVKTRQVSDVGVVDGMAPDKFEEFANFITIRGKITDEYDKPVAGVMVTLKEKMASPRPKYVSKRTGQNGTYELRVPPGKYYVMARESLRNGRPRAGALIGTYGKRAPTPEVSFSDSIGRRGGGPPGMGLQGGEGEAKAVGGVDGEVISGVDIKMFRIPDPEETKKKIESQARANKGEE